MVLAVRPKEELGHKLQALSFATEATLAHDRLAQLQLNFLHHTFRAENRPLVRFLWKDSLALNAGAAVLSCSGRFCSWPIDAGYQDSNDFYSSKVQVCENIIKRGSRYPGLNPGSEDLAVTVWQATKNPVDDRVVSAARSGTADRNRLNDSGHVLAAKRPAQPLGN